MSTSSIWTQRIGGEPFTAEERRQAAVIASGVWRGLAKWSLLVGAVWLFVLLAACSGGTGPTGPVGIDPTVWVQNQLTMGPDTVFLTWYDQSGQIQTNAIAPGQSLCVHFTTTQPVDSARAHYTVTDPSWGTSTGDTPWFLPDATSPWGWDGAFWRLVASNNVNGSPLVYFATDSVPPC